MPDQQELLKTWPPLPPWQPWLRLLFWLLAAAIGVFALRQLGPILAWLLNLLSPFLIALVLAYVFDPVVTFVQRKLRLGRTAGILVLALAILAALTAMLVWLIPVLYQQLSALLDQLKTGVPKLIDNFLARHVDPDTIRQWKERAQQTFNQMDELIRQAFGQMGGLLRPVAQGSLEAAGSVAGGLLKGILRLGGWLGVAVLVVTVTFYYLADMDRIPAIIRKMLPQGRRERIWEILVQSDRAVGGFLRGQLTACACVGVMVTLVLFLVGLRQYAILIGCFAGVMHFIPYLGPVAGATPAILWALFSGSFESWNERGLTILLIVGGIALVQTVDGFVLQPYVVGRHASLHPLAVIFALAVGAQAGIGGMVIAVPVACIVKVLWIELFWKERTDFLSAEAAAPPIRRRRRDRASSHPE
jgi:predicted PurR-regulated permease PerM